MNKARRRHEYYMNQPRADKGFARVNGLPGFIGSATISACDKLGIADFGLRIEIRNPQSTIRNRETL